MSHRPNTTSPKSTSKGTQRHFSSVTSDLLSTEPPVPITPSTSTPLTNEFGGIFVSPEHIHTAFQFLDVDKKGRLTAENLRSRLSIFYDQLGTKDIKLLLNDQNELTEEYLTTLLLTNEVKNIDPVSEAFKAYDPEETGFISRDMLRFVFERMGFGALTEEDINVLVACADDDGDGRIDISDFRKLLQ